MDNCDYFAGYADPRGKPTVWLDSWAIVPHDDSPYLAPELRRMCLHGKVTGHPSFDNGEYVTTSVVLASNGREVETHNTIYNLGMMSADYKKWCFSNGIEVDPQTPIKVLA